MTAFRSRALALKTLDYWDDNVNFTDGCSCYLSFFSGVTIQNVCGDKVAGVGNV